MGSDRNAIHEKLWELHRCDGSGTICRWKLVDEGFLDLFVAQFEKVTAHTAISKEEVFKALASIKADAANTKRKSHETKLNLPASGTQPPVTKLVIPPEKERSLQLAASIATMCNCIGQDWEDLRYGDSALGSLGRWQCDESLVSFLQETFPKEEHKALQLGGRQGEAIRRKLTAVNLKTIGNIELQGTNDLRNHLRVNDWDGKVRVKIFHHTSFLRQHLLASRKAKEQG